MGTDEREIGSGGKETTGNPNGTGATQEPLVGEIIVAGSSPGGNSQTASADSGAHPQGEVKRGRGRPRGSAGKEKEIPPNLTDAVRGTCEILAFVFKMPELSLSEADGKALAKPISDVQKYYNTTIDPKVIAWFNLTTVAAMVFIPRITMGIARKRAEKKAAKEKQDAAKPNS